MRRRFPGLLPALLAACLSVLGLLAAGPPAHASPATSRASQRAEALAIARNALRHLHIGQHAASHPVARKPAVKASSVTSTDWAGYANIDEVFTSAGGDWTEPSVTCSGSGTQLAAFWVGLDGYSSASVEQDGTFIECYEGSVYHFTWWEMYPTNSIQVVGETVAAGDRIAASVTRSGTRYTLKVTDSTHPADSFSTTQTCSNCANSSAEWIAEAPSGTGGVYPLPDFHSWTLTGATVSTATVSGNICSFPYVEINLTGSSGNLVTGPLVNCNSFTVTWK